MNRTCPPPVPGLQFDLACTTILPAVRLARCLPLSPNNLFRFCGVLRLVFNSGRTVLEARCRTAAAAGAGSAAHDLQLLLAASNQAMAVGDTLIRLVGQAERPDRAATALAATVAHPATMLPWLKAAAEAAMASVPQAGHMHDAGSSRRGCLHANNRLAVWVARPLSRRPARLSFLHLPTPGLIQACC